MEGGDSAAAGQIKAVSLQASSSPEEVQSNDSWFSTYVLSNGHPGVLYLAAVPWLPGVGGTTGGLGGTASWVGALSHMTADAGYQSF